MAYDKKQFRDLIIRVLKDYDLYSEAAVNLLMGTAASESQFGTYMRQLGNGPALSPFQVEPTTFSFLKKKYPDKIHDWESAEQLEWDLRLAILAARLKYLSIPEKLPNADDLDGLARYWKKYYNTYKGAGKPEDFIKAYHKYCA